MTRPHRLAQLAFIFLFVAGSALFSADHRRRGATETALDRYVAAPDPAFAWKKVAEQRDEASGATGYALDLVSQNWLTPAEVNRTEWRHWLLVVKPDNLAHSTAHLMIGGGANPPAAPAANTPAPTPPRPSRSLIDLAKATKSVAVELRMVPNQPLIFHGDGQPRTEDDQIAYAWDQYLRTGEERWLSRLPMTKAVVRAMDAVTAFLASEEGGRATVDKFVVAGGSKRGWTAWTAAAVDRRVVAINPIVIDILNVEASLRHHHRAYGFYAPAVGDYVRHGILDWFGTPEPKALFAIEDPFSYRDRLALPKLIINACGDQFFPPDSSQFYFDDLPGVKYLRYIPNTDHSLRNSDAMQTLQAWHHAILNRTPLPQFAWKHGADGALTVTAKTKPTSVLLWQATNPTARDFRLETFGPQWKSATVEGTDGVFTATVAKPEQGWSAYLMELTFDLGGPAPLKLTTDVTVTPRTLPFDLPTPVAPKGFLSR
jgi:PhoPQ-activated pathogenicity-related protein